MKIPFFLIISISIFYSCSSSVKVLKPAGETVSLQFTKELKYEGELLSVTDTTFFFLHNQNLYKVPLNKASKIYVHGYSLKTSKALVLIPQIMLSILVASFAFDDNNSGVGFLFTALIPLQVLSVVKDEPQVDFSPEFDINDLEKLRLYCRYPQGLTQTQWNELLMSYGQEEFLSVPQKAGEVK